MKFIATIISASILTGCTTLADLKKPTEEKYFILTQDHTKTLVRGLLDFKWVIGLSQGVYTLAAEDDDGLYYKGNGDCVLLLSQERADSYLQHGVVAPFSERLKQPGSAGGVGGIWLPRSGVNKQPKIFYELRNTTDGSYAGLTGMAIVGMTENSLAYVDYESEKVFLSKLTIIPGISPSTLCGQAKNSPDLIAPKN